MLVTRIAYSLQHFKNHLLESSHNMHPLVSHEFFHFSPALPFDILYADCVCLFELELECI